MPQFEADETGLRCGAYRLVRRAGSGGMGSVYLAERVDGEVRQRAAIKLLHRDGNDAEFRDLFLRERRILARLQHPAIARMLDAGHTEDGQPYLAMEFIDGVPIDVYAAKLDVRGKLRLFRKVLEAVAYAHRNLIVHRDLKPSNILVDRDGRPKLLDFGIAKILDAGQSQERTAATSRSWTAQYASPEQVRGEAITTASDVYSLGVLLFRLLTGRMPYEFPVLAPSAIERVVCEVQPFPPRLGGDLDNIVLMALRKEPARRYSSVQRLDGDIARFLAHRPVTARPDTTGYRAAKFIRRHRLAFCAAVVTLAAMAAGAGTALYQARRAQRRFDDVRHLAHSFVFDLHDEVARLQGSTDVRQTIVSTGLEYLDDLARTAGRDLALQKELADAYQKIGDAEGFPTKPNLGRTEDALASYRKAGDIYRRIASSNPGYLSDLAAFDFHYAGLLRFSGDPKQAKELSAAAIETLDRVRARHALDDRSEDTYLRAWCTSGDADEDMGHNRQALDEYSRCRQLASSAVQKHRATSTLFELAGAAERVGTAAQSLGFLSRAEEAFAEDESAVAALLAIEPRNPRYRRQLALLYEFRSSLYYDDAEPNLGDPARALVDARRYLEQAEDMVRNDPKDTSARFSQAVAMYRVSSLLTEFNLKDAIAMARDSVRIFDELIGSGSRGFLNVSRRARALVRLGQAEFKAGRIAEARGIAESALSLNRQIVAEKPREAEQRVILIRAEILSARISAVSGSFAVAEKLLGEAQAEAQSVAKTQDIESVIPLAMTEDALGTLYARQGRTKEATACYRRLADLWSRFPESEYAARQKATAARRLSSL
jgi:tetratricopeptide (TPR) repeat protein